MRTKSDDRMLIDAGILPEPTPEKQAMDLVGGFSVMLTSVFKGNKKWSVYDILQTWCVTALEEDIDDEPEFNNHTILRLYAVLIKKGHNQFRVVLPRAFNEIYKSIMDESLWDLSNRKVRKLTYTLTDMFNINPCNYELS